MKRTSGLIAFGTFALLVLLMREPNSSVGQDQPVPQDGVEVLTRGPLHEAYAAPQTLDPKPGPIVAKQSPEPVSELPPDQKPEGRHVV